MFFNCDLNDKFDIECGKGEEVDFIILNLLFDMEYLGWVFLMDVIGYKCFLFLFLRRCSIIIVSWFFCRLLNIMYEEIWRLKYIMFVEMYFVIMVFYYGLKVVYVFYFVYLD